MTESDLVRDKYNAAKLCVDWLTRRVLSDATGSTHHESDKDPRGRYWLGRLAPQVEIMNSDLGKRMERLEPCAVGMRVLIDPQYGPQNVDINSSFCIWKKSEHSDKWEKSERHQKSWTVQVDPNNYGETKNDKLFEADLSAYKAGLKAYIHLEVLPHQSGYTEVIIQLVNDSDPEHGNAKLVCKGRLYEASVRLDSIQTQDYLLDALPDSFRYDRRVPAYGLFCGVELKSGGLQTVDLPEFDKPRPKFWNVDTELPNLSFKNLGDDPVGPASTLVEAYSKWGQTAWTVDNVKRPGEKWSEQMHAHFNAERQAYEEERERLAAGVSLLKTDKKLAKAFCLMNEAMELSARGADGVAKYASWRPFQVGFMLANLASCKGEETEVVDIVWFPTGGGKTETYLGLILTAAFYDRMRGKTTGITAWSRFPLRLLSLQQTQRFANALAAAEIIRRKHDIKGDCFGLGFLIGGTSTPNEIKDVAASNRGQWDYEDDGMPSRLKMLELCPFCKKETIETKFRRKFWRIEHLCTNASCSWGTQEPLPIWVVDTEVWRYLPTVVVGTLDKAAGIAFQTNMKGMVAAPHGFCTEPGHGHTYAAKSGRPYGCLHPKCTTPAGPVPMDSCLYGVTFRLQDELHLLRDSLGAVDAHYEVAFDYLQETLSKTKPKILASSATLTGYERQSSVLYQRKARVFPQPEPKTGGGFWAGPDTHSMRRFLAVAPRGQTIEYAVDRMVVSMQTAIRELSANPDIVAPSFGVHPELSDFLVDLYGTDVIYGNTLRDLDAVVRSAETQWGDIPEPAVNVESLTGRTQFEDVSRILKLLEKPRNDFSERVHVVAASSMMSHGVDVDRLNSMVMLGLPLTTAEFIQATARVGRKWPSLVFVIHKIGRERDASVYRLFSQYVAQGDRFVEPIPITGRSRRVLEKTLPGVAFARILMIHHPAAGRGLWKASQFREYLATVPNFKDVETEAVCHILGFNNPESTTLSSDVAHWYDRLIERVMDPANGDKWVSDLSPRGGPMTSLRDVEDQVEVWGPDAI